MTESSRESFDNSPENLPGPKDSPVRPPFGQSLSARLLVLTVFFIMLAEVAVYVPSISRFRERYLEERLATAHVAILALAATPDNMVSEDLAGELLNHAGAYGIAQRGPGPLNRMLFLKSPPMAQVFVDLAEGMPWSLIVDAAVTLAQNDNRILRVAGPSTKQKEALIEIVIDETPLRLAMYRYSWRILGLSIAIALAAAAALYFCLQWLMVAPMGRLTRYMVSFQQDPEDLSRIIKPTARRDEIGMAERELAAMQTDLHMALGQKARLAALGEAVAKVNHDLRNLITSAILQIEMLGESSDPKTRKATPVLFETMDRAIDLCRRTLDFAREEPLLIRAEPFSLHDLIAESFNSLRLETDGEVGDESQGKADKGEVVCKNDVDAALIILGDRAQLFRVITNLGRNAIEAGASLLTITAKDERGDIFVELADNGPGLPDVARKKLYKAFAGSGRAGGTGLGLAIVREIMRAHGGDVVLHETGPGGTIFCLVLPGAVIQTS